MNSAIQRLSEQAKTPLFLRKLPWRSQGATTECPAPRLFAALAGAQLMRRLPGGNSTSASGAAGPEATADWHAAPPDRVFATLASSPQGMSQQEAARRLTECGPNRLPEAATRGPLARFLYQFHNVLNEH